MARLKDSDKDFFLQKPCSEYTYDFITSIISDKYKNGKVIKSKFKCNDSFTLKANEYINKEPIETTLGSLILNKTVVEPSGAHVFLGYINDHITADVYGSITNKLSIAVLAGSVAPDIMANFLNLFETVGMRLHAALAGSMTPNTYKPIPAVIKRRDELFKKYEKELSVGDARSVVKMAEIEKELLDMAHDILKDDPGMMLYDTKANASFKNNYKNLFITKGAMFDPASGKSTIVKNSLSEGIAKETMPAFSTDIVNGSYPKAIDTAVSGYMSKSLLSVMQCTVKHPDLYDCGTKMTINVTIETANDFLYRYIVEGGKLVQLNDKNIKNYIGKKVKMRSVCFCTSQKVCEVCTGSIPSKLEIDNIGLLSTIITGDFTQLSMKKFHDSTVKLTVIDIDDLFLFE